jgi:hypothetical protein
MRVCPKIPGLRACALAAAAAAVPALAPAGAAEARSAPVLRVEASAQADAQRVASRLGLSSKPGRGGLTFLSPSATTTPGLRPAPAKAAQAGGEDGKPAPAAARLDVEAFKRVRPPAASRTTARFLATLRDLGLRSGADKVRTRFDEVELVDPSGQTIRRRTDRGVAVTPVRAGLPVVGPAAKVTASFAPDGKLRSARYAVPRLAEGQAVELRPTTATDAQVAAALQGCAATPPPGAKLGRRMVYWAPRADAKAIHPHVEYQATFTSEGGERVQARTVYVPAGAGAPVATVTATSSGPVVRATIAVKGGRAPFTARWTPCSGPVTDEAVLRRPSIEYRVAPRGAGEPFVERVLVTVTDADGQAVTAVGRVQVTPDPAPASPPPAAPGQRRARAAATGVSDVGFMWVGATQGLPASAANVQGGIDAAGAKGNFIRYNLGEYAATKGAYLDPASPLSTSKPYKREDTVYADNVDLAFYTGHAGANGWTSTEIDATYSYSWTDMVRNTDPIRFGDGDAEYLVIAACGPLQPTDAQGRSASTRWKPMFHGLHLLMGYATTSVDNTIEAKTFFQGLVGTSTTPEVRVTLAWQRAAIASQPSDVQWAWASPVSRSTGATHELERWSTPTADIPQSDVSYLLVRRGWS